MKAPTKLLLIFTVTAAAAAGFTAWEAGGYARQEFARARRAQSAALVAQFQHEYAQQGERVAYEMQSIADAESTLRMALDLSRPESDPSVYENDARGLAEGRGLDYLELAGDDGTVISSTQGPERIGQKNDWVVQPTDWNGAGAFLERIAGPGGADLQLMVVRAVHVGDKNLYLIGGLRLDQTILGALAAPGGTRALLYRNLDAAFTPSDLAGAEGAVEQADRFGPLIESAHSHPNQDSEQTIAWSSDAAAAETFTILPLAGRQNQLLAVFLVGSTQAGAAAVQSEIRTAALLACAGALLIGVLVSLWISARFSRPIERLTAAIQEIADGGWEVRIKPEGRGEARKATRAFNEMTSRLSVEKERIAQAERVAAWRELARHLAFELKGPLFGLQITMESLARGREQNPEGFHAFFLGSLDALRSEFASLNGSIGRFNEFANMPPLQRQRVNVNELVRNTMKGLEPRFSAPGVPPVTPDLHLAEDVPGIQGDPELLRRALENLVSNSCEAMRAGGRLLLRTSQNGDFVRIEVSDSHAGFAAEEGGSEFAAQPITAKMNGTGLGLAVAQAVVSDHGGRITIEAAPGAGTTYRIELPLVLPASAPIARPATPSAPQSSPQGNAELPPTGAADAAEKPALEPTASNL